MPHSAEKPSSPAAIPPKVVESSRNKVMDVAASLRRMGNNHELFCEVVGIYDEDSPELLERIRAAIRERDAARLHRAAHSLKGLVSNFGASAAAEGAYVLENMGTTRDLTGCEGALRVLESELERLHEALRPFAPGPSDRSQS
jgi:two-component system sensor histidine kinase/response regulator